LPSLYTTSSAAQNPARTNSLVIRRSGGDVTSQLSTKTMPPIPWRVNTTNHPGSSRDEIEKEPDWQAEHQHEHRIGYKNRHDRRPGVTHEEDEHTEAQDLAEAARNGYDEIARKEKQGDLVNFRDIVLNEKDLHLRHPENRSLGWRFVLQCSEDYVKNKEEWPANVQKRQKEEEAKKKEMSEKKEDSKSSEQGDGNLDEEKWKREKERSITMLTLVARKTQGTRVTNPTSKRPSMGNFVSDTHPRKLRFCEHYNTRKITFKTLGRTTGS
jgi:hypothetical protein